MYGLNGACLNALSRHKGLAPDQPPADSALGFYSFLKQFVLYRVSGSTLHNSPCATSAAAPGWQCGESAEGSNN